MNKILVSYATLSGSTAEVAQAIGEEIASEEVQVEVLSLEKVANLSSYSAVILGAPMIMGWHRSALKFLRLHRKELKQIPFAVFATAMSLTYAGNKDVNGVPVYVDEKQSNPPKNPDSPTFREQYSFIARYAVPILRAAGSARPVSMAFFGGRLDYYRLKLPARLFVMLVVQAQPGDRRNWQAIRSWANGLSRIIVRP